MAHKTILEKRILLRSLEVLILLKRKRYANLRNLHLELLSIQKLSNLVLICLLRSTKKITAKFFRKRILNQFCETERCYNAFNLTALIFNQAKFTSTKACTDITSFAGVNVNNFSLKKVLNYSGSAMFSWK